MNSKKTKILHIQLRSIALELILFWRFQLVLNRVKPVYDPDLLGACLTLTANQLGQYSNSHGRSAYCYAEFAVFA